jgi:hypothetical protein
MVEPEPLLTAGLSLTREPREVVKTKQWRKKERNTHTHTGENEIENFFGEKKGKEQKNPQACAISLVQCPLINICTYLFSFSFFPQFSLRFFFTFFSEEKEERI